MSGKYGQFVFMIVKFCNFQISIHALHLLIPTHPISRVIAFNNTLFKDLSNDRKHFALGDSTFIHQQNDRLSNSLFNDMLSCNVLKHFASCSYLYNLNFTSNTYCIFSTRFSSMRHPLAQEPHISQFFAYILYTACSGI